MNEQRTGTWKTTRAAAGTGKTSALTKQYLSFLAEGLKVEEIVAITFTRKAAAELIERVSMVLHAVLAEVGGEKTIQSDRAIAHLGTELEIYRDSAPKEAHVIRAALAGLSVAPIGTTDSFVMRLLQEHVIDAGIVLPNDKMVMLDHPVPAPTGMDEVLDDVARGVLSPHDQSLDERVRRLLRHYTLSELHETVKVRYPHEGFDDSAVSDSEGGGSAGPARLRSVFGVIASQLVERMASCSPDGDVKKALRECFELPDEQELWESSFTKCSKEGGKNTAGAVVEWLRRASAAPPPELAVFLAFLKKNIAKRVVERFFSATPGRSETMDVVTITFDVEGSPVTVPITKLCDKATERFLVPSMAELTDALRHDIDSLRSDVMLRAVPQAVTSGRLGYDDLLNAAVTLFQPGTSRAPRQNQITTQFRALMVDEVQDSSPAQLELFFAMADACPHLHCYFVGDSRQSIYLFRNAVPAGLARLAERGEQENLLTNYRSVPALVEAHKSLFGPALAEKLTAVNLSSLEPLEALTAHRSGGSERPVKLILPAIPEKGGEQSSERPPPVSIGKANARTLQTFAEDMATRWKTDARCTAAVLAPTWKLAVEARDVLRARLDEKGQPHRAFIEAGGTWTKSRVLKDLAILIAALSDPGNDLAWLGLWKLPKIGLSDRAMALIRHGKGIVWRDENGEFGEAPGWLRGLGWINRAEALEEPHSPDDIYAFARARSPLLNATRAIGRVGTARIVDDLARTFRWRELLAVSPYDDAVAHLELALEWIRDLDEQGYTPEDILTAIVPGESREEAPRLELRRPDQHIACTTIYQAKGLKWDHVCVLSPGVSPSGIVRGERTAMTVSLVDQKLWLVPIRIDPDGALSPVRDPIGKITSSIRSVRKREEEIRLAYVAVTRAAESVVMALANYSEGGTQRRLRMAWEIAHQQPEGLAGVELLAWEPASAVSPLPTGWVAGGDETKLANTAYEPESMIRQSPSTIHESLSKESRTSLADDVARQAIEEGGVEQPGYEHVAAPEGYDHVRSDQWGTLVHGWLERWGFRSEPTLEAARRYLSSDWGSESLTLATWLVEIAKRIRGHEDLSFWQLVSGPDNELYFELPLIGTAPLATESGNETALLSGRIDLLIRSPKLEPAKRWNVIDFKAGNAYPGRTEKETNGAAGNATENNDVKTLIRDAKLRDYAPQLESYRESLDRALATHPRFSDERVGRVGLWFVRVGAGLWW